MISDEMRELLSAYADGELRASDVARVEEMTKRDPEMRGEVESYRRLGRKLRAWDADELDGPPSSRVKDRAILRAELYLRAHARPKGSVVAWALRPATLAAAVLVALAAGFFVAASGAGGRVILVAETPVGTEITGLPDRTHWTGPDAIVVDAKTTVVFPAEVAARDLPPDLAGEHGDRFLYEGISYGREAHNVLRQFERTNRGIRAAKARTPASAESVSRPGRNIRVETLLLDYVATDAPSRNMVVLNRDRKLDLRGLTGPRASRQTFLDSSADADWVAVRNSSKDPLLLLAGEILVARDATKRVRIVAADTWVEPGQDDLVPVIWGDSVSTPKANRSTLHLRGEILDASMRRALAGKRGSDVEFLKALHGRIEGRPADVFGRKLSKTQERTLASMRRALKAPGITGFAILKGDEVYAVELFADHKLLAALGEKLLRGYVRDGGDSLRMEPLSAEGRKKALGMVKEYLARLPEIASRRVQGENLAHWPEKMERVTLRNGVGKVVGSGIVQGDGLVHLTLFGN